MSIVTMPQPSTRTSPQELVDSLEQDGIAVIPDLVTPQQLRAMQRAFDSTLRRMRWNDFDGYEQTERYRHMVQNVLLLDQAFLDVALHPVIKTALDEYIGDHFALVETKGWLSLATRENFHGWHGDAWYNQEKVKDTIPREVKLAVYLTDVKSGAFNYIKGSHRKQAPRLVREDEIADVPRSQIAEVLAPAGTAFLFDTSGIHRQSYPILEPRQAIFYNYHDPRVPLQQEDIDYDRYHPLLLNAAFLGDLSPEDHRILGFGEKTNYIPHFERQLRHTTFQNVVRRAFETKLRVDSFTGRVRGRLQRMFSGSMTLAD